MSARRLYWRVRELHYAWRSWRCWARKQDAPLRERLRLSWTTRLIDFDHKPDRQAIDYFRKLEGLGPITDADFKAITDGLLTKPDGPVFKGGLGA